MHMSLNIAYYNTGNYGLSKEHLDKAKIFYDYTGDIETFGLCDLNLINIYRYNNEFDKAFEVLNISKERYEKAKIYLKKCTC